MGADDRADVVDDHRFPDAETPLDLPSYKLGILQRIAVADENRLLFRGDCKLLHAVHQGGQRGAAATRFADIDQMARVIHMHDRLDAQHRTDQGGCGRNAPTALEKLQVFHSEPMAEVKFFGFQPIAYLFNALSFGALLCGEIDQQALAQRSAEGIDRVDFPLRIFLRQLLNGDRSGIVRIAESGGKGDAQDVFARCQKGFHRGGKRLDVDRGGGAGLPRAKRLIKGVQGDFPLIQIIIILLPLHHKGERKNGQVHFLRHRCGKVAGRVCDNGKCVHWEASFPGLDHRCD